MASAPRIIDCQHLVFSNALAQDRILRAQDSLGQSVLRRLLCFALYLMGATRSAIGQALDMPPETAKSIIKAIGRDGLAALEDRRHRDSHFRPAPAASIAPTTVRSEQDRVIVDFGLANRRLEIPLKNAQQVRAVLLSLLNSGFLKPAQVAEIIGLTPAHTATLARRLASEGLSALIDKRQGQKSAYRVGPEVKAELIQQFTIDIIARGKTSGQAISDQLLKRCQIFIPARTVRYHLAQMGLPTIKHSLPLLVAALKKSSKDG